MTLPSAPGTADWTAFATAAAVDAVLAGGLVGYGLLAEDGAPILGGIGWLATHLPHLYCRHACRSMPAWLSGLSVLGGVALVASVVLASR